MKFNNVMVTYIIIDQIKSRAIIERSFS